MKNDSIMMAILNLNYLLTRNHSFGIAQLGLELEA